MTELNVWVLVAYLLVLGFLTSHKDRWSSVEPLRKAWVTFAWVPLSLAFFTAIKATNIRNPRDLLLTEIWQGGVVWVLLGISIFQLSELLKGKEE